MSYRVRGEEADGRAVVAYRRALEEECEEEDDEVDDGENDDGVNDEAFLPPEERTRNAATEARNLILFLRVVFIFREERREKDAGRGRVLEMLDGAEGAKVMLYDGSMCDI